MKTVYHVGQYENQWLPPAEMLEGDVRPDWNHTFRSERDAWRHYANLLEEQVSSLQAKLTNARLKASALTKEPYEYESV